MNLPWILYIQVQKADKKNIRLLIPLFLFWLLLLPLLILATPFILIAAAVTWKRGFGRMFIGIYPLLWSVSKALSGLHIQVESPGHQTLISIH